jgi:hypothetical protein
MFAKPPGGQRARPVVAIAAFLAALGCSPADDGSSHSTGSGGGAGGAAGAVGGTAGALAGGQGGSGGTSGGGAGTGAGGTSGGGAGTGAGGTSGGSAGAGGSTGYDSMIALDSSTPLDQVPAADLVQACERFNDYFSQEIPQEDQVRAACVTDAVYNQGAVTVDDCNTVSSACITAVGSFPPNPCVEPGSDFSCPATVAEYETCATEITEQERQRVALLVCASLEEPDIQAKLDAASVRPASCIAFATACPGFFPVATATDGGAP